MPTPWQRIVQHAVTETNLRGGKSMLLVVVWGLLLLPLQAWCGGTSPGAWATGLASPSIVLDARVGWDPAKGIIFSFLGFH